jgi:hypothetical protein
MQLKLNRMLKGAWLLLFICLFQSHKGNSQANQELTEYLSSSIIWAVQLAHDFKKYPTYQTSLFSLIITFNDSSKVESILFSETDNLFVAQHQNNVIPNLSRILNNTLEDNEEWRAHLANKYIIAIVYMLGRDKENPDRFIGSDPGFLQILKDREEKGNYELIPEDWFTIFKGIDYQKLEGKSLALLVSGTILVF